MAEPILLSILVSNIVMVIHHFYTHLKSSTCLSKCCKCNVEMQDELPK